MRSARAWWCLAVFSVAGVAAVTACSDTGSGTTGSSTSGGTSSGGSTSGGTFSIGSSPPGTAHADLDNGGAANVEFGPQGGYMVWLSARWAPAPSMEYPLISYTLTSDGTTLAEGNTRMAPQPKGSSFEDSGAPMILDWSVDASAWMNKALSVEVRWLDDNDQHVIASVTRQWTATCCRTSNGGGGDPDGGFGTRDGDGGVVGGGALDGGEPDGAVSCAAFCANVMDGCAAESAPRPFASVSECESTCAAWPAHMLGTDRAGNSLRCRATYAQEAESDPSTCARLQQTWDVFCVSR